MGKPPFWMKRARNGPHTHILARLTSWQGKALCWPHLLFFFFDRLFFSIVWPKNGGFWFLLKLLFAGHLKEKQIGGWPEATFSFAEHTTTITTERRRFGGSAATGVPTERIGGELAPRPTRGGCGGWYPPPFLSHSKNENGMRGEAPPSNLLEANIPTNPTCWMRRSGAKPRQSTTKIRRNEEIGTISEWSTSFC